MSRHIARAMLLSLLILAGTARAELIYQPPPGTAAEALWRSAGSQLLEGIARLFDALGAVEAKNTALAQKHLESATSKLRDSVASYEKISSAIPRPRNILFERLSAEQRQQIGRTFEFYKIPLPKDETDAAALARRETLRLVSLLGDLRPKIIAADLGAVQHLLAEVTRLQRIGTQTAELMSGLR